jgi:hypothetical protein
MKYAVREVSYMFSKNMLDLFKHYSYAFINAAEAGNSL